MSGSHDEWVNRKKQEWENNLWEDGIKHHQIVLSMPFLFLYIPQGTEDQQTHVVFTPEDITEAESLCKQFNAFDNSTRTLSVHDFDQIIKIATELKERLCKSKKSPI